MLSSSGLDRDAKHQVGLYTLENYTSSSLLSTELLCELYQVLGVQGRASISPSLPERWTDRTCLVVSAVDIQKEISMALGDNQEGFLEVVTSSFQTN